MEMKTQTLTQQAKCSHFKSLARYLKQRPANVDFKLSDWLSTLDTTDLVRIHQDTVSIYASYKAGTRITRQGKSLANAACLAYGAEAPGIEPKLVMENIDLLLRGMRDAVHIEALARCGWVIVTGRMSIWPETKKHFQVSERGRAEGEYVENPRTRELLGLPPQIEVKPSLNS